jgi:hypothetical protein
MSPRRGKETPTQLLCSQVSRRLSVSPCVPLRCFPPFSLSLNPHLSHWPRALGFSLGRVGRCGQGSIYPAANIGVSELPGLFIFPPPPIVYSLGQCVCVYIYIYIYIYICLDR